MRNTKFGVLNTGIEFANFGGSFGGLLILFRRSFKPQYGLLGEQKKE